MEIYVIYAQFCTNSSSTLFHGRGTTSVAFREIAGYRFLFNACKEDTWVLSETCVTVHTVHTCNFVHNRWGLEKNVAFQKSKQ
jgi:hypothetical protein